MLWVCVCAITARPGRGTVFAVRRAFSSTSLPRHFFIWAATCASACWLSSPKRAPARAECFMYFSAQRATQLEGVGLVRARAGCLGHPTLPSLSSPLLGRLQVAAAERVDAVPEAALDEGVVHAQAEKRKGGSVGARTGRRSAPLTSPWSAAAAYAGSTTAVAAAAAAIGRPIGRRRPAGGMRPPRRRAAAAPHSIGTPNQHPCAARQPPPPPHHLLPVPHLHRVDPRHELRLLGGRQVGRVARLHGGEGWGWNAAEE